MLSSLEYCPPISTGVVLSERLSTRRWQCQIKAANQQTRSNRDWRLAPFSPDNCSLNSCEISYARFDLLGQIQKRMDVRCYRLRFWHCRNEVTHAEGGKNLAPVAYGNTEGVR